MRYKLLLTGSNDELISKFFYNTGGSFECMTSSLRNEDLLKHIKYFKPNALVFCFKKESIENNRHMFDVKDECALNNIQVVLIGSKYECDIFRKNLPGMSCLNLITPITIEQITTGIMDYFNKNKKTYNSNAGQLDDDFMSGLLQELPAMDPSDINVNIDDLLNNVELSDLSSEDLLSEVSEIEKLLLEEESRRKHILVVDDDKGVLKMLKTVLSDEYDVATALSGKIALKFLQTKNTDLILLDYEMPGERGPEVFTKIKADPKLKDIPVVFLTGVTESSKIKEVLAMKPQGYLLKPINMERLNNSIKDLIG